MEITKDGHRRRPGAKRTDLLKRRLGLGGEVGVAVGDEERESRRRDHSGLEHVDAGGCESCGDGSGQEVTGDAGVAGHDCSESLAFGFTSLRSTALAQDDSSRLGQGERNAKDFLKNNPEIMADLEGRIRATAPTNGFQEQPLAAVAAVDDDDELGDEE